MSEIISISTILIIFLIITAGVGGFLIGSTVKIFSRKSVGVSYNKQDIDAIKMGIGVGLLITTITSALCIRYIYPSAIDVYRGNTVLKVISIDGEPTDSIVLFKKE